MNCDRYEALLNDYVDQVLSEDDAKAVFKHSFACESCTESIEAIRLQKQLLRSMPVPAVSEGFKKRVIESAVRNPAQNSGQQPAAKQGFYYKFAAAAMISALVLWLGMLNITPRDDTPYLVLVGDQVRNITVAIVSEQALDSVEMHVEISENLELKGMGNKKQINWTTGLREGVNVISLPVVGIAIGEGEITTRVHLDGKEKVMHIRTKYKQPGNVYYGVDAILQS